MEEIAAYWEEPVPWLHMRSVGAVLATIVGELAAFWSAPAVEVGEFHA